MFGLNFKNRKSKSKELRKILLEKYLNDWMIDSDCSRRWNKDGSVDIYQNINVWEPIPFKIGTVFGDFRLRGEKITSLKNFPSVIRGWCAIIECNFPISVDIIKDICDVKGDIYIDKNPIFSYCLTEEQLLKLSKLRQAEQFKISV